MGELLAELLGYLLAFLWDVVIQVVGEFLAELGMRASREALRSHRTESPVLAAIGYAIFGAVLGGLSMFVVPPRPVRHPTLRVVNLIAAPMAAGLVMKAVGDYRARRGKRPGGLESFGYAFLFALAFALVRFFWSRTR